VRPAAGAEAGDDDDPLGLEQLGELLVAELDLAAAAPAADSRWDGLNERR
jgi:hypothetical protein